MTDAKPMIRGILFITLSNLGDVILTTPVLSVLRGNFPQAKIVVLVGPKAFHVFLGSDKVDELIVYDKNMSLYNKWLLMKELSRYEFDLAVDLRHTLIPWFLGVPDRTALFRWRKRPINKREEHLALLKPLRGKLGIDLACREPFDFYSQRDLFSLKEKLAREGVKENGLVVMAAGSRSEIKRWYLQGFTEVGEKLRDLRGKTIVLVGDEKDIPVSDEIMRYVGSPCYNLCGQTTFRELGALMSLSDLVVANDSAALQLAYELRVPSVAIFGPTDSRKYGRENGSARVIRHELPCSPCEKAQCWIEEKKACLYRINPEEVCRACLELLDQREKERVGYPH